MELSDFQRGYIAGIIDGEGSICLTQNRPNEHRSPSISVTSTTQEMLFFLQELCGGHISKVKKVEEHHKQAWHWVLRGDKSIELMTEIYSYLLVPEKYYRAKLIVQEYKKVTPRNGRYSEEALKKKLDFENRFFEYDPKY